MTKERPILFSAPMVRAILSGTKTQTRRVLKQATGPSLSVDCSDNGVAELSWLWGDGPGYDVNETIKHVPCPYGQPGDRLWVRETWAHGIHAMAAKRDEDGPFVYAATHREDQRLGDRWKPSIHMPRAASRLTLEVTGVRVERLQAISKADAIAEGIERGDGFPGCYRAALNGDSPELQELGRAFKIPTAFPELAYRALWESINGPDSWAANPWVWVVEFARRA